jgi:hypothetical protein
MIIVQGLAQLTPAPPLCGEVDVPVAVAAIVVEEEDPLGEEGVLGGELVVAVGR